MLHNRGSAFSLDPKSPNVVAPRKRPFHSIIAGFVMKDGQPLMTFGNMGGSVQPETHAQHIVNMIDHGMNVQMTTDAARFTHNQNSNVLSLETNLFNLVGAALKAKGHDVRSVNGGAVGGYQGILFTRDPRLPEPTFDRRSVTDDLPVNGVYRAGRTTGRTGRRWGGEVVSAPTPSEVCKRADDGSADCVRDRVRDGHQRPLGGHFAGDFGVGDEQPGPDRGHRRQAGGDDAGGADDDEKPGAAGVLSRAVHWRGSI